MVVIISQYICLSNHHAITLNLRNVVFVCQLYRNKARKMSQNKNKEKI